MKAITATDRSRLIRLASTMPVGASERRAILVGLQKTSAAPIHWKGQHIIIDSDRMMSFKEIPKDEYGQVYDAALLTSRNGVRMKKLVEQIVLDNKAAMLRMKTPWEATRFVGRKVMEATGKYKTPDWHTYSMPD